MERVLPAALKNRCLRLLCQVLQLLRIPDQKFRLPGTFLKAEDNILCLISPRAEKAHVPPIRQKEFILFQNHSLSPAFRRLIAPRAPGSARRSA